MFFWQPYVPVAERKKKAEKKIAALKKKGQKIQPVVIEGRTIAKTFWGKAWCNQLESFSDYSNRLQRGRTYVRNGSVIDLKIRAGKINALVSGSSIYTVNILIDALNKAKWKTIIKKCSGRVDSLIELLQGKFSKGVMEIITSRTNGLFPEPNEINFDCSCPDAAHMCKHISAVLYGVGARLEEEPEKLFLLRQVDHFELFSAAKSSKKFMPAVKSGASMDDESISSLFGIEIDKSPQVAKSSKRIAQKKTKKSRKKILLQKNKHAKSKVLKKKKYQSNQA